MATFTQPTPSGSFYSKIVGGYIYSGCYISALAHIRVLILSIYVLLEYINAIYKYGHA